MPRRVECQLAVPVTPCAVRVTSAQEPVRGRGEVLKEHLCKWSPEVSALGKGGYVIFPGDGLGTPSESTRARQLRGLSIPEDERDVIWQACLEFRKRFHVLSFTVTGLNMAGSVVEAALDPKFEASVGSLSLPEDLSEDGVVTWTEPVLSATGRTVVCDRIFLREKHVSKRPRHRLDLRVMCHEETACRGLAYQVVNERLDLSPALFSPDFSDVRVVFREASIPAHRVVLARSPVLRKTFLELGRPDVVDLSSAEGAEDLPYDEAARYVLYYLYTGRLAERPGPEVVDAVVRLCVWWDLPELLGPCEDYLIGFVGESEGGPYVIDMHQYGRLRGLPRLEAHCLELWREQCEVLMRDDNVREALLRLDKETRDVFLGAVSEKLERTGRGRKRLRADPLTIASTEVGSDAPRHSKPSAGVGTPVTKRPRLVLRRPDPPTTRPLVAAPTAPGDASSPSTSPEPTPRPAASRASVVVSVSSSSSTAVSSSSSSSSSSYSSSSSLSSSSVSNRGVRIVRVARRSREEDEEDDEDDGGGGVSEDRDEWDSESDSEGSDG